MRGKAKSRSKAIAVILRSLIAQRDAEVKELEKVVPGIRLKLWRWEEGINEPSFSAVLDLLTLLRCEVILVPLGWAGGKWAVLNKLPYNEGGILEYPREVKKRGKYGVRRRPE